VLGVPDDRDLERLSRGVRIEGRRTEPARVVRHPHRRDAESATLTITIREGRNRQVRDMCDAIGHPVTLLKRVAIGPIRDPMLRLGHWRELSAEELRSLKLASQKSEVRGAKPPSATSSKQPRNHENTK
jgi:23S rRNA pseudouridine2605 synthase